MGKKLLLCLVCAVFIISVGRCYAEEMTMQLVKNKVLAAVKMLEAEGVAGFGKIRDPNGAFRFGNGQGYIWIHEIEGMMVVHPTQPHLEGTNTINLQDSRGFKFIIAMNRLVENSGEGWAAYLWPKPGKTSESSKVAYVKKAVINGKIHVVGCGMYDVGIVDLKQAFPNDTIVKF
jgi:signal transduction histidine kinase